MSDRDTTTIRPEDIDMSKAVPVVSSARKFVMPVPALVNGGSALVYEKKTGEILLQYQTGYPDGIVSVKKGTSSPRGNFIGEVEATVSEPIRDYKGNPKTGTGIVFYNGKDSAWQGVTGDGTGIIIINEVGEEQADAIIRAMDVARQSRINSVMQIQGNPDPASMSQETKNRIASLGAEEAIKRGIQVAAELDLTDIYDSNREFMASKLSVAGTTSQDGIGLYKRDDRDVNFAVMLPVGPGRFQGPAGEPQAFNAGDCILMDGKGSMRKIDGAVFERTWVNANGSSLQVSQLPQGISPSQFSSAEGAYSVSSDCTDAIQRGLDNLTADTTPVPKM